MFKNADKHGYNIKPIRKFGKSTELRKKKIADANRDNIDAKHSLGLIEGKTVRQWAEHYGVSTTCIYSRLDAHGNPHDMWVHPKTKIIEGKSVRQWAEHYGVGTTTIHKRLRTQGHPHTPKKSLIKAKSKSKQTTQSDAVYDGKTKQEWAEHYGVGYDSIHRRILNHGHPHPRKTKKWVNKKYVDK